MSAVLTLDMIGSPRRLAQCGMEEMAVHHLTARPSGGILFARATERGHKDEARRHLVDLLGDTERFPNLRVLSMPGLDWRFEVKLLGRREGDWARGGVPGPQRTHLTCVENDRALYQAAVTRMPGMARHWKMHKHLTTNEPLSMETPPAWAEASISNRWVDRFHFANVDDLMAGAGNAQFDAAWLDYTGFMTVKRLRVVRRFFERNLRPGGVLAVTVLKARWPTETGRAIAAAGGHTEWLRDALPGRLEHDLAYSDTGSPMAQVCITKDPA